MAFHLEVKHVQQETRLVIFEPDVDEWTTAADKRRLGLAAYKLVAHRKTGRHRHRRVVARHSCPTPFLAITTSAEALFATHASSQIKLFIPDSEADSIRHSMDPISNEDFLARYGGTDQQDFILASERTLIDARLNDLAEKQKQIVQEKKDVAEQSGDNWHDGAFIATDNAANAIRNQAASLFSACKATVVELPNLTEHRVTIGSKVVVEQRGVQFKLMIVGMASLYNDNDENEVCSVMAPLARALIGSRRDDSVTVSLGKTDQVLKIIDVDQSHAGSFLKSDPIG